ncbi:hypothetical protein QE152_g8069 [Popillia japonica]|uniref:Retroviral polymerase SH3-like domain-containing protein n=1 Tax=Popillia japonica TaxID=7064 RepID=A0AAW1M5T7_POPJA
MVGYCDDSKGYRLLDLKNPGKIVRSRDVIFLENLNDNVEKQEEMSEPQIIPENSQIFFETKPLGKEKHIRISCAALPPKTTVKQDWWNSERLLDVYMNQSSKTRQRLADAQQKCSNRQLTQQQQDDGMLHLTSPITSKLQSYRPAEFRRRYTAYTYIPTFATVTELAPASYRAIDRPSSSPVDVPQANMADFSMPRRTIRQLRKS